MAAASAANLGFGLCTDSIGIKVDGGQIKLTRAAFGGNYMVTVVNEKAKPQIATVRPKAFAMPEKDASKSGEVVKETFTIGEADLNTKFLEFIKSQVKVNLVESDIIVSGGRGTGGGCGATARQQHLADRGKVLHRLATWWDQFAGYEVSDLPRVHGGHAAASAEHVATALALWRAGGPASSVAAELAFWREHLEGFRTAAASIM